MTPEARRSGAVALQGHRAGFASRAAAAAIDLATITLIGVLILLFAALVRYLVLGPPFGAPTLPDWLSVVAGTGIPIAYFATGWAIAGRTVGMQVLGLRLQARSGRTPGPLTTLPRAVLCVAFPLGLLWVLFSRRNASLQDLVLGTAVIYDWSYGPLGGPAAAADSPTGRSSPDPAPGTVQPSLGAPAG